MTKLVLLRGSAFMATSIYFLKCKNIPLAFCYRGELIVHKAMSIFAHGLQK